MERTDQTRELSGVPSTSPDMERQADHSNLRTPDRPQPLADLRTDAGQDPSGTGI